MKKNNYRHGFTLIELLAVIAIIGILAGLTIIYIGQSKAKGRDSVRKGALHQFQDALNSYQNDNSRYPENLSDLVPNYMDKTPTDPKDNQAYAYRLSADGNKYEINTTLELNRDNVADNDGGNESFPIYEVGDDLTLLP